jgi:hypothetical protein
VTKTSPKFGDMIEPFKQLLSKNGSPRCIVWITPEDILVTDRRSIYVRVPVPQNRVSEAGATFDDGIASGLGVLIATLCESEDWSYCYVWSPRRAEDVPQGMWPLDGNVKLSAKSDESKYSAIEIKNSLVWALLKLKFRSLQDMKSSFFSA